jgi:GxxExxY protein
MQLRGLVFARQLAISLDYEAHASKTARPEFRVVGTPNVELQANDAFAAIDVAPIISSFKATTLESGLLLHFNTTKLKADSC